MKDEADQDRREYAPAQEETDQANLSLSQLTPFGGTAQLNFSNSRFESTNQQVDPNPAFTLDLDFSFTQPLLRNFGRSVTEQNLIVTALSGRAEARVMIAQGRGGAILNVSSGETTRPAPFMAAYGAAKAAINHLTQTMAVELGPHGIRVNAMAPGTTLTEQVRAAFDDAHVEALVQATPLHRMTEPEELGRMAVWLASDLARCTTGQFFLADAGAFLSRTRPANKPPAQEGISRG